MTHHRRGLRRLLRDDDLADAIEADWRTAPLSDRRRAMLDFAVRLTTEPVRAEGLTDRDVLDLVEVTAYYAYANRIADGLGLTTEPWIPDE